MVSLATGFECIVVAAEIIELHNLAADAAVELKVAQCDVTLQLTLSESARGALSLHELNLKILLDVLAAKIGLPLNIATEHEKLTDKNSD